MQNPQPFLPPTGPQHGQAPAPAAAADGAGHAGQHDGPLPDIFSADRPLDAAAPAFTPEHHQQGHLSYGRTERSNKYRMLYRIDTMHDGYGSLTTVRSIMIIILC
jgi:hypothetical protein